MADTPVSLLKERNDPERDVPQDLGFGSVVSARTNYRLLNRDGSFNVVRAHASVFDRYFSYHSLLSVSWPKFFLAAAIAYVAVNAFFAELYLLCGPNALAGPGGDHRFLRAFFFSVHTFATIGYGVIYPNTLAANSVVTVESLIGLLAFAVSTGLIFARFSRPVADLLYSKCSVVFPYRTGTAWAFRIVNRRRNQLVNVNAIVMYSRFEETSNGLERRYYQLRLERDQVAFFPMNWTVVHAINRDSPLFGWTKEMLKAAESEFDILITAVDETFNQNVHSRASFTADELVFGRKFKLMYRPDDRSYVLDLSLINETEAAPISEQVFVQ